MELSNDNTNTILNLTVSGRLEIWLLGLCHQYRLMTLLASCTIVPFNIYIYIHTHTHTHTQHQCNVIDRCFRLLRIWHELFSFHMSITCYKKYVMSIPVSYLLIDGSLVQRNNRWLYCKFSPCWRTETWVIS
jgi:hypothetical protein